MFHDEKYDALLLRFSGTNQDDFHQWTLLVKAALNSRELAEVFTDDNVEDVISEKGLSIINSAVGDNQLRAVNHCTGTKAAWDKLHTRYAGTSMVRKLSALNTVPITKLKRSDNIGNYIAVLKSHLSSLAMKGLELDESIKVAIFLPSVLERSGFAAISALVTSMQEQLVTWCYNSTLSMEEQIRISRCQAAKSLSPAPKQNMLAYFSSNAGQ